MDPIEVLVDEHRLIKRGLSLLEAVADKVEVDPEGTVPHIENLIDFIRTFADACHHAKEEDTLFTEMEKRGFPVEGGPIALMLEEHKLGRQFVTNAKDAAEGIARGDISKVSVFQENARSFVGLLRQHIDKEDNILYPVARQIINPEELEELMPLFKEREEAKVGAGAQEKYVTVIESLESVFKS